MPRRPRIDERVLDASADTVMLQVRVSRAQRDFLRLHAVRQGTTSTRLIRAAIAEMQRAALHGALPGRGEL